MQTWEEKTGFAPGAKQLSNGQKDRQNVNTVICDACGHDTKVIEDKAAKFSDALRKANLGAIDIDWIVSGKKQGTVVIEYTTADNYKGDYPNYLTQIDVQRNKGFYKRFSEIARAINAVAIIVAHNRNSNRVWYKQVWSSKDTVPEPWLTRTTWNSSILDTFLASL